MSGEWCSVCCTRHRPEDDCPGELPATGEERHGWRVNVATPDGVEAYGVLVCESRDLWRARILTYPNVLWVVPGGGGTLKFFGRSPQEAEERAVDFIREFCRQRRYELRREEVRELPADIESDAGAPARWRRRGVPAPRKIRFLPVRFGVVRASEPGGLGNLSETGLFIITDTPVKAGLRLSIVVDLKDDEIPLRGEVRWMRQQHDVGRSPGMGVRLLEPPPKYVDYVRSLS